MEEFGSREVNLIGWPWGNSVKVDVVKDLWLLVVGA